MHESSGTMTRREAIRAGIAAGVGLSVTGLVGCGGSGNTPGAAGTAGTAGTDSAMTAALQQLPLITKQIPSTGEMLPVVGIGTNRYDVATAEGAEPLCEVIDRLAGMGGKLIDTARGYGRSEEVIGQCITQIGNRDQLFLATKYSVRGNVDAAEAAAGMDEAFTRLRTDTIDLMMVHNLGGTDTLLPLMTERKQAGRFRYTGISTSSDRQYEQLAAIMRREPLDFIEIDYSIGNRSAEQQMLPLAQERGMAVIVNVPFGGRSASMLQEVSGHPVPDWASEFDATSWPQVFLKYIVSHPAVTAVIPGTTRLEHAVDNHLASRGRLPDAAMRRRIEQTYDAIVG